MATTTKETLKIAENVLAKIHKSFVVGSDNISPIAKHYHPLVNTTIVSPELLSAKKKQKLSLDALVDRQISDLANKRVSGVRELVRQDRWPKEYEGLHFFIVAKIALEHGAGNCEEMVTTAMCLLKQMNFSGLVECMRFDNLDHTFILLNRKAEPESDIRDWRTWGKDTIILDPWLNVTYTADKFASFWEDKLPLLNKQEEYKRKGSANKLNVDSSILTTNKMNSVNLLPLDSAHLFPLLEPYEGLMNDPHWAKKLIKNLPNNIKLNVINLYKNIYGKDFVTSKILTASDFIEILNTTDAITGYDMMARGWVDLYKNEYESGKATPEQTICYLLTTTDIKSIDLKRAYEAWSNISKQLSPSFSNNIENLCYIISKHQESNSFKYDQDTLKEIFRLISELKGYSYINLQGLNFNHTEMDDISLNKLVLPRINFSESRINNCEFTEAILSKCDFSNAVLNGCNFYDATLDNVNFRRAIVVNCDFSFANLTNAILIGVELKSNNFSHANLDGAVFIPEDADGNKLDECLVNLFQELNAHPQADILITAIAKNIIRMMEISFPENPQKVLEIIEEISKDPLFTDIKLNTNQTSASLFSSSVNAGDKALQVFEEYKVDLEITIATKPKRVWNM